MKGQASTIRCWLSWARQLSRISPSAGPIENNPSHVRISLACSINEAKQAEVHHSPVFILSPLFPPFPLFLPPIPFLLICFFLFPTSIIPVSASHHALSRKEFRLPPSSYAAKTFATYRPLTILCVRPITINTSGARTKRRETQCFVISCGDSRTEARRLCDWFRCGEWGKGSGGSGSQSEGCR
jgi:hypothetical protein